ncbi:hypothetical protein C5167_004194 [Papaver somniferum]|nr:hypothetical protein C5167_004194 [Papaver somniferum]
MEGGENAVRNAFGGSKEDLSYFWGSSEKHLKLFTSYHPSPPLKMEWNLFLFLDDGSHDIKLKDGEGSSGSGSVENFDGESSSPGGLTERSSGCFELGQGSGVHTEIHQLVGPELGSHEDIVSEAEVHVKSNGAVETKSENDIQIVDESAIVSNLETGSGSVEEAAVASENYSDLEKPLDLDDFNSASEIQVLGLERLKAELQAHGL